MGFETLLLLCDVLRRPGRFRRACVCAVLAHLQVVWLCPGAGVGTGAARGPSRSWQGLLSDLK